MGISWQHGGGSLPIALALDEVETTVACPTCARTGGDGTLTIRAAAERESGTTPARCAAGHVTMVQWSRAAR